MSTKKGLIQSLQVLKSEQEKLIIKILIENFEDIQNISLTTIADLSYCSKTSVVRTLKKLGYTGYVEFQLVAKLEANSKDAEPEKFPTIQNNR
ncbi:MAG: MurR/RpiR family transcriptional regulator, partial [Erysipelotrichaceae bacterium]